MQCTFESRYIIPLKEAQQILHSYKFPSGQTLQQQELSLIKQLKIQLEELSKEYEVIQQGRVQIEGELWQSHVNAIYQTYKQCETTPIFDKNSFVTIHELNLLVNEGKKKTEINENLQSNIISGGIDKLREIIKASDSFLDDLKNVSENIKTTNFSSFVAKIYRNVNLEDEIHQIFKMNFKHQNINNINNNNNNNMKLLSSSTTSISNNSFKTPNCNNNNNNRISISPQSTDDNKPIITNNIKIGQLLRDPKKQQKPEINKNPKITQIHNQNQNSDQSSNNEDNNNNNNNNEISSDTENKLLTREQAIKELKSGYDQLVRVPNNSKLRVDIRKSIMQWGKDKKILENSVRQINRFVNSYEKEVHNRYKIKKDQYCKKMMALWDIFTNCHKDKIFNKSLKQSITNDHDFASRVLDNIDDHINFILKSNGATDEIMQKSVAHSFKNQEYDDNQFEQKSQCIVNSMQSQSSIIVKDPFLDVNIFSGVIKIKIKVSIIVICNTLLYKYLPNEQIGDTIFTRKHIKSEEFEKIVNQSKGEDYVVGWLERVKKGSRDLESVFKLMNEEGIIITFRVAPDIKLYLLTEKQAKEYNYLTGKQFYCNPESLGNCFIILGFVDGFQQITHNDLFIHSNQFAFDDLTAFNHFHINTKRNNPFNHNLHEPQITKKITQENNYYQQDDNNDDDDDKSSISSFSSEE